MDQVTQTAQPGAGVCARVPVTVLTGYLGAGKTTLLNRILSEDHGRRYAVIINEFGEVGIDSDLILSGDEELFEMNNGCICCKVRGDLIRTLHTLLTQHGAQARAFDAIIVETSGLADPGPVAQTFLVDPFLLERTELDSITTVVDAAHLARQLADSREANEQIAFADLIVLNKTEMVTQHSLAEIEQRITRINPMAPIHRAQRANVDLARVLHRGGFDLDRITALEPNFLVPSDPDPAHVHDEHCGHDHVHDHRHDAEIRSVSLTSRWPMSQAAVIGWLDALIAARGEHILRAKGIIDLHGESQRFVFQSVHMLCEGHLQRAWQPDEERHSRLVFIGRHLDAQALQTEFEACAALVASAPYA